MARTILVLRPLGLGDLLTGIPALRAVRDAFPGDRVVLACPGALGPLARLSGAVDEILDVEPLVPLPREADGADVAIDLHGNGPESHRVLLAARPGRLVAFRNDEVGMPPGAPVWRADEHEVARWCRLLAESGIPADPGRLDLPAPSSQLRPGATVVHPGAASPARRWPVDRFAAVARAELSAGRPVLVTGGPDERGLVEELVRLCPGARPVGPTSPLGLAGVVASAGRLICGDTGVAHLATAFGTPSVVLFGPTSPAHWGPPPGRDRHRVLWAGTTGDPHAGRPDPGLLRIGVRDVLRELAALDGLGKAA